MKNSTQERTTMNSYLLDPPDLSNIMGSNLSELTHRSWHDAPSLPKFDIFKPLRHWLDNLDVSSPKLAHKLCQTIPAQCPFERDLKLFGRTLLHIPPMCKLNPVYEEVVSLRFRAMCYLADECGEDISQYC
jgi:Mo-dependent nitrogenase C-terminus